MVVNIDNNLVQESENAHKSSSKYGCGDTVGNRDYMLIWKKNGAFV